MLRLLGSIDKDNSIICIQLFAYMVQYFGMSSLVFISQKGRIVIFLFSILKAQSLALEKVLVDHPQFCHCTIVPSRVFTGALPNLYLNIPSVSLALISIGEYSRSKASICLGKFCFLGVQSYVSFQFCLYSYLVCCFCAHSAKLDIYLVVLFVFKSPCKGCLKHLRELLLSTLQCFLNSHFFCPIALPLPSNILFCFFLNSVLITVCLKNQAIRQMLPHRGCAGLIHVVLGLEERLHWFWIRRRMTNQAAR